MPLDSHNGWTKDWGQVNGSGIPANARDEAFMILQRLPDGKTLNPSGTGMGLAIVLRIVEMNGGRC